MTAQYDKTHMACCSKVAPQNPTLPWPFVLLPVTYTPHVNSWIKPWTARTLRCCLVYSRVLRAPVIRSYATYIQGDKVEWCVVQRTSVCVCVCVCASVQL